MDFTLVSQWLGHANLETILIYAHADMEMMRKAIEKASSVVCEIAVGADVPNSLDDDILKRFMGYSVSRIPDTNGKQCKAVSTLRKRPIFLN